MWYLLHEFCIHVPISTTEAINLHNLVYLIICIVGPGHVTFWRLCTDQELEQEKEQKRKQRKDSGAGDELSPYDDDDEDDDEEGQSGIVKMVIQSVVSDQKQFISGMEGKIGVWSMHPNAWVSSQH